MDFATSLEFNSEVFPGVRYSIRRVTFAGRLELTRRIADLLGALQFHEAGRSMESRAAAAALAGEIDRLYLAWGLLAISGLTIDGLDCTPDAVILSGPETLCAEIVSAIKRECTLSERERKNSLSHSISTVTPRPGGDATNAGRTDGRNRGIAGSSAQNAARDQCGR